MTTDKYEFIGADPEFVILDKSGKPVPAHSLGIPPKEDPIKVSGGFFHRDGFNLEVNPDVSKSKEELVAKTRDIVGYVKSKIPQGFRIAAKSSFEVDLSELEQAPYDIQQFGCEPSQDAYKNGESKVVSLDGMTHKLRYCGGHCHFSYGNRPEAKFLDNPETHPLFIKMLDRYAGIPIAFILSSPDQWRRREQYGQAGEYRTQFYSGEKVGVEYRTPPSEMWKYEWLIYHNFQIAAWVTENFANLRDMWDKAYEPIIQRAINTGEGLEPLLPTIKGLMSPARARFFQRTILLDVKKL